MHAKIQVLAANASMEGNVWTELLEENVTVEELAFSD